MAATPTAAPPPLPPPPSAAPADVPPPGGAAPGPFAALERLALAPEPDDRMVRGIAAGIAREAGLPPALVRAAFVVLSFAGGVGVLGYVALWVLAVDEDAPVTRARAASRTQLLGLASGLLGLLLLCRGMGLWFGDSLVWPLTVASLGSIAVWSRAEVPAGGRPRLARARPGRWRVVGGALMVLVGLTVVLADNVSISELRSTVLALLVGVAAVVLLAGPWLTELAAVARDEREERLRERARSDIATHLHDSVLQSLALIQRSADRPARMAAIARQQERELRSWLYGDPDATAAADADVTTLDGAITALVDEVEQLFEIEVEAVTVGTAGWELAPSSATTQVLAAAREALVNAATHAQVTKATLYVELATPPDHAATLDVFVRDRGRGFDPTAVTPTRRGLRDSVRGRLDRLGGTVEIDTAPGEGTEVHLHLTRPVAALGLRRPDVPHPTRETPEY